MPDAFIETSVAIGLVFRHAGERAACASAIPTNAVRISSRYVQFEVARGFLRSLITLHNLSFEYSVFSDLHQAAHSGQNRFKHYRMHTWLGAFVDFEAAMEAEDGCIEQSQKLEAFRAKLRGWIRRGWSRMQREFAAIINKTGCREALAPPRIRSDGRLDQVLPIDQCGIASACGLKRFIDQERRVLEALKIGLNDLPRQAKDAETIKRISAIDRFLKSESDTDFSGRDCHQCGDALIAVEAPVDHVIITKNAKHFVPIAQLLGKRAFIAQTATSTQPNP